MVIRHIESHPHFECGTGWQGRRHLSDIGQGGQEVYNKIPVFKFVNMNKYMHAKR